MHFKILRESWVQKIKTFKIKRIVYSSGKLIYFVIWFVNLIHIKSYFYLPPCLNCQ